MTPVDPPPGLLDIASLALLLLGIGSGAFAYVLVTERAANPLVLIPAIIAATVGATHLMKQQAPRDGR